LTGTRRLPSVLLCIAAVVCVWSGIAPTERFTWFMEVSPAVVGAIVLIATRGRFPLTSVSYVAICLFALILMIGGHYTYAAVPAGFWVRDALGLERNHFDRLGHLFQGIAPALIARELLVRRSPLRPGRWLTFLSICVALSVSAVYEIFEWQYAVFFGGEQAETFLGSQGDPWDAQTDMLMAWIGATGAVTLLAPLQ
jgi:putative membrane protein